MTSRKKLQELEEAQQEAYENAVLEARARRMRAIKDNLIERERRRFLRK